MDDDDQTRPEPPLDPAAERLRSRLTRLMLISGGFMILGFIAVFAALVYKLGFVPQGETRTSRMFDAGLSSPDATPLRVSIPAGARLLAADLDGDRALLVLGADGDGAGGQVGAAGAAVPATMILYDLATGQPIMRYDLVPR